MDPEGALEGRNWLGGIIGDSGTLHVRCLGVPCKVLEPASRDPRQFRCLRHKKFIQSSEKVWELPLWEEYSKDIKSKIADIKNIGTRGAGTITAAAFLSHFVGNYPWVHLDIAGTAWTQEGTPKKSYRKKGATGVGVLLSIDFLRNL